MLWIELKILGYNINLNSLCIFLILFFHMRFLLLLYVLVLLKNHFQDDIMVKHHATLIIDTNLKLPKKTYWDSHGRALKRPQEYLLGRERIS